MRPRGLPAWCLGIVLLTAAGPAAAELAEPDPEFVLIQRAFLREDFAQVAGRGPAFLAKTPDTAEARRVWIWTALSLDRVQRTNDAIQTLDQLKRRLAPGDPLWSELLFWEGDISRRAMQVVRAKIAYQRLLERDPRTTWAPQAKMGLGLIYLQQQAYPSALRYFQEVAKEHADTPAALDALLLQGVCQVRLRAYEEAVRVLRPLTERLKSPDAAAQAAVYLGESLTGLGRHEEAIAAYQRARADAPASSWGRLALFGLGWAQFHQGRCAESLEALDQYLARPGEHYFEALFAQGSCLLQTDREAEALQRFQHILTKQPSHPLALESGLAIVDIHLREEDFTRAKTMAHTLLRRPLDAKDRAQLQLRLGSVALGLGNVAQARTVFELATHSGEPAVRQPAFSGLGEVHLALGDVPAAAHAFDQAREPAATAVGEYAAFQRARLHLQLQEYSEAVAIFQRLIASAHARVAQDAGIALALAYLQQGETDIARRQLEAIRQQRQGQTAAVRAGYYLALILVEEGGAEAARTLCEDVLAKAPQSDEAVDARLLLAELMLRERPAPEVIVWLRRAYQSPGLPARHRGKLAKRLGDFAREQGAYGDALRWYDEAERWWPAARGEVRYRAASCLEEAGDLDAAIQRYRTVDQPPWQVRGRLAVAKLLERQGRLPEAEVIYESLAAEPIAEAKVVKERLAALRGRSRDEEWE